MSRAPPAAALLALVLAPLLARGADVYHRTLVPGRDFCVVWPGREYVYRQDAAGSLRTPGASEFAAIDAAVASWRAVSGTCSDFVLTRGPDIEHPQVGYVQGGARNENVITFREADCNDVVPADDPCIEADTCANLYACWEHGGGTIGLTTTTFSFRTGYILDADIEFNAAEDGRGFFFTTLDSPPCDGTHSTDCVGTDIQNTATHELGHVMGLDHVPEVFGSTMEPTAFPGETAKRTIDVGSQVGFCAAYPRGLPPTQCGERAPTSLQIQAVTTGPWRGCGVAPGGLLPLAALLAGGLGLGRARRGRTPSRR